MEGKIIYLYFGTTAELIKLAPIIITLKKRKLKYKIIISGQNNINFKEVKNYFGYIKPDIIIDSKYSKPSILHFGIWSLRALVKSFFTLNKEFAMINKKNVIVVVHGDTVSSLIGAIVAKLNGIRLAHIESGLRSFSFMEPFPEEATRVLVSYLSDIHFCPNKWSMKNLIDVRGGKVDTFQNTLLESMYYAMNSHKNINYNKLYGSKYFILVVHRQEHVVFGKKKTKKLIHEILECASENLKCIFITHEVTEGILEGVGDIKKNCSVVFQKRLPYGDFINLLAQSEFLVTDGGSNQEEAYYLGKPCLLLRNRTERIEGLNKNVVLSSMKSRKIKKFINNYKVFHKPIIIMQQKPSDIIVDNLIK